MMGWFKNKKGDEDMATKKKESEITAKAKKSAASAKVDEAPASDVSPVSDPVEEAAPVVAPVATAPHGVALVHELIAEFVAKAAAHRHAAHSRSGISRHAEEIQAATCDEVVAAMQRKIA